MPTARQLSGASSPDPGLRPAVLMSRGRGERYRVRGSSPADGRRRHRRSSGPSRSVRSAGSMPDWQPPSIATVQASAWPTGCAWHWPAASAVRRVLPIICGSGGPTISAFRSCSSADEALPPGSTGVIPVVLPERPAAFTNSDTGGMQCVRVRSVCCRRRVQRCPFHRCLEHRTTRRMSGLVRDLSRADRRLHAQIRLLWER